MKNRLFLAFILVLGFSAIIDGQEILIDLQSIPIKKIELKESSTLYKSKAAISLPFFDDFAWGRPYLNSANWINSYALINQTYAINPPTIGVATFDAINQYGKLYSHLTPISEPADTLTSQPIDLALFVHDSIYFSFQYQPKGLGKAPQVADSLVVEFLAKEENVWYRVWAVSADYEHSKILENNYLSKKGRTRITPKLDATFFKVMVPIKVEKFLKMGFQFRFINYASSPPNTDAPSIRGNGDHWHIDLVHLKEDSKLTDTILDDVTFSKPLKSILKNYESIPWKHFNTNQAKLAELANPLLFTVQQRYLGAGPQAASIYRLFDVFDISNQSRKIHLEEDAANIPPFQTIDYSRGYEYSFESDWTDSAKFGMKSYMTVGFTTTTPYLHWNDTVSYTQQFFNYYAYDDGSSEGGYGWFGLGTQNALTALKYHTYVSDSLKGILIYFNKIIDFNPLDNSFDLMIWSDNSGKPGTVLYQKTVKKPKINYDKDTLYIIDSKLKLSGDFWIGTKNRTEDMLNIGFDLNNNHNDKLYYNRDGTWMNSQLKGSLMMKPIFGKFALGQTGIDKPTAPMEFTMYPNPATNQINLNMHENAQPQRIRIVNLAGQVVLNMAYERNHIELPNLQTGIYLIQVTFRNQTITTKKLVIIK